MNPVIIITRNNLELTKLCIESVEAQTVNTSIHVFDNCSTDGTSEWLKQNDRIVNHSTGYDLGVSAAWNLVLESVFGFWGEKHALVLNNDAIIPPWFYEELLSYKEPFITGVAVDYQPWEKAPRMPLVPHPDFSAYLITKSAWKSVGAFNAQMRLYCSDCDWHIRAHRAKVGAWKANVPYYHVNSQTMKRAEPEIRASIQAQANQDREVFQSIYGCLPGSADYERIFADA
ncbi:MAG: glycosyltransferase [Patescibacteria group bacterium]|nr:glycosyltransferase [Patescibacteria group bacterium]